MLYQTFLRLSGPGDSLSVGLVSNLAEQVHKARRKALRYPHQLLTKPAELFGTFSWLLDELPSTEAPW